MKYTVDRIEEGIAVLENGKMNHISISAEKLPKGVREGSILLFDGVNYIIDTVSEDERRKSMLNKQNFLFNRTKKD